jgi:pSer/pThr/pTyr-binding forkhead associated (FHA) protein
MTETNDRDDDGGTILEPIGQLEACGFPSQPAVVAGTPLPRLTMQEAVPRIPAVPRASRPLPSQLSEATETNYRPAIRPPVPLLTVLDDGEVASGETVRLRDHVTVIGRSDGFVRISHDPLVSGRHAEIVREGAARPYQWTLRDLGSSNGTFVSCVGTVLRPDRLIILGSRRFRFQPSPAQASKPVEGTMLMDSKRLAEHAWPTLVETTAAINPLRISLAGPSLSVGRPGNGNRIEIDDPLLAPLHAHITLTTSGEWRIEALPSRNGIWVQVNAIRLVPVCRFQCGEQRFLFVCNR